MLSKINPPPSPAPRSTPAPHPVPAPVPTPIPASNINPMSVPIQPAKEIQIKAI